MKSCGASGLQNSLQRKQEEKAAENILNNAPSMTMDAWMGSAEPLVDVDCFQIR